LTKSYFSELLVYNVGLPDPVGRYPLNSSTGAEDTSGFNNPGRGVISNANPAPGVYGERNGAYAFTGARSPPSYLYLNASGALDTR